MDNVNTSIFGSDRRQQVFAGGIEPGQINQSFAATIDTAAWTGVVIVLVCLYLYRTECV